MAHYHHKGAFSGGGRGRLLSRFKFWGAPGNGADATDHKWTTDSSNFHADADQFAARDHVCRPVIVGSDGKATPVLHSFPHHKDDDARANGYVVETRYRPTEFADVHGKSSAMGFHGSTWEATAEPAIITAGGWTRPSRAGWAMPPYAPLEKATNPRYVDGGAVEFPVAEFPGAYASKPNKTSSGAAAFYVAESPGSYASKPNKASSSMAVIDSREAAKKYGGQFTW